VYLRLVMNFTKENVALFIAAIGILSVVAQVKQHEESPVPLLDPDLMLNST